MLSSPAPLLSPIAEVLLLLNSNLSSYHRLPIPSHFRVLCFSIITTPLAESMTYGNQKSWDLASPFWSILLSSIIFCSASGLQQNFGLKSLEIYLGNKRWSLEFLLGYFVAFTNDHL